MHKTLWLLGIFSVLCGVQLLDPNPVEGRRVSPSRPSLSVISPTKTDQEALTIQPVNPVVNEGSQLPLTTLDQAEQPVTGVFWESSDAEIALVDSSTGVVTGIQRGFALITARLGSVTATTVVVVSRISTGPIIPVVDARMAIGTNRQIYLSESSQNVILKQAAPADQPQLFAGQPRVSGNKDGNRLEAQFHQPTALAIDRRPFGGVYVADTGNHSIRLIGTNDQVTTVIGTGSPGMMNREITPLSEGVLNGPRGVAHDAFGGLYIADTENHAIFYADFLNQELRLIAGRPGQPGKQDGTGKQARFHRPMDLAVSPDGNWLAVADAGNQTIRLVSRIGEVITLDTGPTRLKKVQSLHFDGAGNLYFVDKKGVFVIPFSVGQSLQLVSLAQPERSFNRPTSVVVEGTEAYVFDTDDATTTSTIKLVSVGTPEIISLNQTVAKLEGGREILITGRNFAPETRVLVDQTRATVVTVESPSQIRMVVPEQEIPGPYIITVQTRGGLAEAKISIVSKPLSELASGEITTIAGTRKLFPYAGPALSQFIEFLPASILTTDSAGNLFFFDQSRQIRKFNLQSKLVTTILGNGKLHLSNKMDSIIETNLDDFYFIDLDPAGNLYVISQDHILRVDLQTGVITPLVQLDPKLIIHQIVTDQNGNLFIAAEYQVLKIDRKTGNLTRVAGVGHYTEGQVVDGGLATETSFYLVSSVALDRSENLFLADREKIYRVDALTGILTTFAGSTRQSPEAEEGIPALEATLYAITNLKFDAHNHLFFQDTNLLSFQRTNTCLIRRIDAQTNIITTVTGKEAQCYGQLDPPFSISAIGKTDQLLVTDQGNLIVAYHSAILMLDLQAGTVIPVIGAFPVVPPPEPRFPYGFTKMAVDGQGILFLSAYVEPRHRLYRLDPQTGDFTQISGAGTGVNLYSYWSDLAIGPDQTLYIVDRYRGIYRLDLATNQLVQLFAKGGMFAALDTTRNALFFESDGFIERLDLHTGTSTVIAGKGQSETENGDGGPAIEARLGWISGLAVDAQGTLFIAQNNTHTIRRIDAQTGIITTCAGTGKAGFNGDGKPATQTQLNNPQGLTCDTAGNLLIADSQNRRVRQVDAQTGVLTTIIGSGSARSIGDGGSAFNAGLPLPVQVGVDRQGNIFVRDGLQQDVRRVDKASGLIHTVAAGRRNPAKGDSGPANQAILHPRSMLVDQQKNLYVADLSGWVRFIEAQTGIITSIAGTGRGRGTIEPESFIGDGNGKPANFAQVVPTDLKFDEAGNLLIGEENYGEIRRIDAFSSIISTVIGQYYYDDPGCEERDFCSIGGLTVTPTGDVFFSASRDGSGKIYHQHPNNPRTLVQIAGRYCPSTCDLGDGRPALEANLTQPKGVAQDKAGNILIADSGNHRIRRIDAKTGIIQTIAGGGISTADGIPATQARLDSPQFIVLDGQENIFFTDTNHHRVCRIDVQTGILTTIAGSGNKGFSGDGAQATQARLAAPFGLAIDSEGNLYIADFLNSAIRVVKSAAQGIPHLPNRPGWVGTPGVPKVKKHSGKKPKIIRALDSPGR